MLDDLAMMPASVSRIIPWSNQSPMTRSCRARFGGTLNLWRGNALPASISDDTVSTFCTEPGS